MNFEHMPELGWKFGHPLALGPIASAAGFVCWRFRRDAVGCGGKTLTPAAAQPLRRFAAARVDLTRRPVPGLEEGMHAGRTGKKKARPVGLALMSVVERRRIELPHCEG